MGTSFPGGQVAELKCLNNCSFLSRCGYGIHFGVLTKCPSYPVSHFMKKWINWDDRGEVEKEVCPSPEHVLLFQYFLFKLVSIRNPNTFFKFSCFSVSVVLYDKTVICKILCIQYLPLGHGVSHIVMKSTTGCSISKTVVDFPCSTVMQGDFPPFSIERPPENIV